MSSNKYEQTEEKVADVPEGWEIGDIENFLEAIIDYRGKTPKKSDSGIETLSAKAIKNGRIDYSQVYFISEKTFKEWETRGKPIMGDVLLTSEGPLGQVAQLDKQRVALAQRLIALRGKKNKLDNAYLKYYLMSPAGQNELLARATGTTVQGIKQSEFRKVKILMPPFPEQQLIAKILSDLDSRITVNEKTNEVLEALGETVFKRWFVDFEFPNQEGKPYKSSGGEMVDSEPGRIPYGWEIKPLNAITDAIFSGGTPDTRQEEYWNGNFPWLSSGETSSHFINKTDKAITQKGIANSSTRIAKVGDVIVASAGQGKTRGQVSLCLIDTYINQSVIAIRAKSKMTSSLFLYFDLSRRYSQLRALSDSNSIRGSLTTALFKNLEIVKPPFKYVNLFSALTEPLIKKIEFSLRQNYTLAKIRDLLLPKLMSGKIRIPIEKQEA
jgi:type I restriction enzyme S subunit